MCSKLLSLVTFTWLAWCTYFSGGHEVCPSDNFDESGSGGYCSPLDSRLQTNKNPNSSKIHYVLYEVNEREGFNLRRDVYMRIATMMNKLGPQWILVFPPWSLLYHWNAEDTIESPLPWRRFFDIESFRKIIPVLDFDEYLKLANDELVDVYCLEHYPDTFNSDTQWTERFNSSQCAKGTFKHSRCKYFPSYRSFVTAKKINCVQMEGTSETLKDLLVSDSDVHDSILIQNAEIVVHSNYGDFLYWSIRRSMRFNRQLINIANQFRKQYLYSEDTSDDTVMLEDWTSFQPKRSSSRGGPYLAVHLRRGDFALARPNDVPSIECAFKQILAVSQKQNLLTVYIASDATIDEYNALRNLLETSNLKVYKFHNQSLLDGELAVVDQWIAAHAKIFIGTYDSTFTFRIQEEREILGFKPEATFNAFCRKCNDKNTICKQESEWKIVY